MDLEVGQLDLSPPSPILSDFMATRSVASASRAALRSFSRQQQVQQSWAASCMGCRRSYATPSTSAAPTPAAAPAPSTSNASAKVEQIVDQISTLSLLEAAELVSTLKSRLNIADIAVAAPVASAAPAAGGGDAAAAAEPEKPKEKTMFTVTLTKIDAAQKAKAIKEVKAVQPNMNLVEAKKFVESLPKVLKENATKEDSEKLKKALEAVGAAVEVS